MKASDTSFLMEGKISEKKIQKSQFRVKIILAVTKIMLKFSQYIHYLGEYLTDIDKRGLERKNIFCS